MAEDQRDYSRNRANLKPVKVPAARHETIKPAGTKALGADAEQVVYIHESE